ncbi:MAG: hypothetical protein GEV08_10130 [Acidimicrobiia bacterium]|nr:hypothetical protein [Acidimicrobiia bacterium]
MVRPPGAVGGVVAVASFEPTAEVVAWVEESCEAQGVPVKVTDVLVVRTVATLLSAGREPVPVSGFPRRGDPGRVEPVEATSGRADGDPVEDIGDDGPLP